MRKILRFAVRAAVGALVLAAIAFGIGALALRYAFQETAYTAGSRLLLPELLWQRGKYLSIRPVFDGVLSLIADDHRMEFSETDTSSLDPVGAPPGKPYVGAGIAAWLPPVQYGPDGVPRTTPVTVFNQNAGPWIAPIYTQTFVDVASVNEFHRALARAEPGTYIRFRPGEYSFRGRSLQLTKAGRADAPIIVGAARLGTVRLNFELLEGFHILAPYWIIENLEIDGVCGNHSSCEHAFHVVGNGRNVVIRNNRVTNFNAALKVNGRAAQGQFPDNGLLEYNSIYNDTPRHTGNPVTPVDVVAVSGWRVSGNFIADFAKDGSDFTSYAAFFKGGGRDDIFERNLIMCEWRHRGGIRLGLSLGDGGTSQSACRDGKCKTELTGGVIRNNIIMNCPKDVGIYLNKAVESIVINNAILGTRGIDVRFSASRAVIANNVIDGRILARDGGRFEAVANITSLWQAITLAPVAPTIYQDAGAGDFRLVDPDRVLAEGLALGFSGEDFCGRLHSEGNPDIGPFNYRHGMACLPIFEIPENRPARKK